METKPITKPRPLPITKPKPLPDKEEEIWHIPKPKVLPKPKA